MAKFSPGPAYEQLWVATQQLLDENRRLLAQAHALIQQSHRLLHEQESNRILHGRHISRGTLTTAHPPDNSPSA